MNRSAPLAGLAAATSFTAAALATMLAVLGWDGQIVAAALLLALPLYIVAREAAASRKPRPPWVPPWERTLHRPVTRPARTR